MEFTRYEKFPVPAAGAFGVTGLGLPNGRLLVWDGDALHLQKAVDADAFQRIAGGYAGDPGFVALSPDGATVLLGQGFGGALYRFLPNAPVSFSPAAVVGSVPHYSGVFLTESLVLLDTVRLDFSGTDLQVLDVSGAKSAPRMVVAKPVAADGEKQVVVEKPPFSYSASVSIDRDAGMVYAMDGNTRELRAFSVAALLAAYAGAGTLDWSADGVLIGAPGQFFSGGVAGITPGGRLVVPGSAGFLQPGGIQLVNPRLDDPSLAAVEETLDPAGTQPFYSAIYNGYTDTITAVDGFTGDVYAPEGTLVGLPVAGPVGLTLLAAALLLAARRTRR
jgi:hypothetical protein